MPFTPEFGNINTATGRTPTPQQLGEKALKANLEFKSPAMTMGQGVAKFVGDNSTPALIAPSTSTSTGGLITPPSTSTPVSRRRLRRLPSSGGAPSLPGNTTPTDPMSITPTGGPGAPPPMPAPEPTSPPLVAAPPTKKKTSPMLWLGLALAAAVLLD